jgi:TolA-binding protein
MNLPWRIAVYVVLAVVAYYSASRFLTGFSRQMERATQRLERFENLEAARAQPAEAAAPDAESPAEADTNQTPAAPSMVEDLGSTQAVAAARGPADTNRPDTPPARGPAERPPVAETGFNVVWGVIALLAIVALGISVGREVSGYLAHRVHREIYGEASEPVGDPEYDEAEAVWARGEHLEAIRLLREFLNKKPHKLHAAFRIAEIYEKDLHNPLAAALEYESILNHRFEAERWGWAAIHLVNLYNRLGQAEKAEATLRRILAEQPHTQAAAKAREHLGEPLVSAAEEAAPAPEDGQFHLPRGFKPKKG